jgi:hypothetical protein
VVESAVGRMAAEAKMNILIFVVALVLGIVAFVAFVRSSLLDIRCPKCKAVVEPDAFVKTEGGRLRRKCEHCGHVWPIAKDGKERDGERMALEGISEQNRHTGQRDETWKRILGPAIVFLVGVVVTTCSVVTERYQRRIESLPVVDAAAFQAIDPGQDVIITGILDGNTSPSGLVAYARERYEVSYSEPDEYSDGGYRGRWQELDQTVPGLTIRVDDKEVNTVPVSSARMGGRQHSQIIKRGAGRRADGGDIPEGSIRVVGYRNGDVVTFVGQRDADGRLIPERLYGGTCAQFLESVQFSGLWILVGIGLSLGGLASLTLVTMPRRLARMVVKVQSLLELDRRQRH